MNTLSVFEHEWLPIGRSNGCRLSDEQAAALERLEPALPPGALEWRRDSVKFAQFCGVVQLGPLNLEILPKIARRDEQAVRSRALLVRMLHDAGLFTATPVGETTVSLQRANLLDLFIDHFRASVQEQLWHGMLRRYVTREESIPRVRGRIDFARQLRENLTTPQLMACRHEEFERDNLYNRSLVYVLGLLMRRAADPVLRQRIRELIGHFGQINPVSTTAEQMESLRFGRADSRWEPVFRQAGLFLKSLYPDIVAGSAPALALLFDMNRLFEAYVASRLRTNMREYVIRAQGPQRYLASDSQDRPVFRLRPDITVSRNGQIQMIVDRKWKLLEDDTSSRKISPSDVYQMLAYAERYGCGNLSLIYPNFGEGEVLECLESFRVQNSAVTIRIHGLDLRLTDGSGARDITIAGG